MPNADHSAYFIASTTAIHTSTISRHHSKRVLSFRSPLVVNYSDFPLAISDMPVTLSPFGRQKAVQMIKTLSNVINQPFFFSLICLCIKKADIKAVPKV
jgi:hypothetical protein